MDKEMFCNYVLPIIMAILTGIAGWIGVQIKQIYKTHVDTKTKRDVVRTCVMAVEQLYHDLGGPEKLAKAQTGATEMLNEKGIPITELELRVLIESVVCEFNYGFHSSSGTLTDIQPAIDLEPVAQPAAEYTEEEGASE